MKLLTKVILKKLPIQYATDKTPSEDKICQVKFFDPRGSWTWYAVEFNPETEIFFGWVDGSFPEWGYFALSDLKSYRGKLGLGIERDIYFTPKSMKEIRDYKERGLCENSSF